MSYLHETWSKWVTHKVIILAKFHENRAKIVELLPIANFLMCAIFFDSDISKNQVFLFYTFLQGLKLILGYHDYCNWWLEFKYGCEYLRMCDLWYILYNACIVNLINVVENFPFWISLKYSYFPDFIKIFKLGMNYHYIICLLQFGQWIKA